ncbi:response regulator transcription factor [Variovorax dokdonensis]|uniref:Response regulator transcription factor n=1 Tax=Variovorax dokdonensis TaxID=344883 RepID=A0ABT7N713_9BURK|nr:response regulator transcription factor [Variovorax dokdonensis]MDM0043739.1 response regulator transcription factor [Variovorax dokdonensis]
MTKAAPPLSAILVVDDDAALRRRLRGVVAEVAPAAMCDEAENLNQARMRLQSGHFDLVLLDVGLPDGSGLDLLPWLSEHAPQSEAVVVSSLGDDATILRAIQGGAVGYLLKNGGDEELALSLASLQRGGSPIDPVIARRILRLMSNPANDGKHEDQTLPNVARIGSPPSPAKRSVLSDREVEVLRLVAQGLTNREIGRELALSVHTVECHAKNIYRKLAARSRAGAVYTARELGLLG